jgi:hypothetical protein
LLSETVLSEISSAFAWQGFRQETAGSPSEPFKVAFVRSAPFSQQFSFLLFLV